MARETIASLKAEIERLEEERDAAISSTQARSVETAMLRQRLRIIGDLATDDTEPMMLQLTRGDEQRP
jgi:outer membrane murein-binding lipoprotein Lpp